MSEPKHAVVAGHICLDVIPGLEHLPPGGFETLFQPGRLVSVGKATFSTGGPVSNTGLALCRLGIPTQLIAKVGTDSFGKTICDIISQKDPDLAKGITPEQGETTSYTVIISPPGVDRIFLHCPGANDTFSASDINYELVAKAHLFHFGYPPVMRRMYMDGGKELVTVYRQAKATGVTTSLDMATPDPSSEAGKANWKSILCDTLPFVDIFVPSIEELLYMLHWDMYRRLEKDDILEAVTPAMLTSLSDELLELGVKIILLKLGHRGAYLRTANVESLQAMGRAAPNDFQIWADQELWAPCFKVDVVGTTGSGDATIAGFLSAILRGLPPEGALSMAVAVGACNVEAADALSSLRSWEETRARIEEGWARCPLDLSAFGWRQDAYHKLWMRG